MHFTGARRGQSSSPQSMRASWGLIRLPAILAPDGKQPLGLTLEHLHLFISAFGVFLHAQIGTLCSAEFLLEHTAAFVV